MSFSPRRLPVSRFSVCTALIGAVYCALLALPTVTPAPVEIPCASSGCVLFQDFTIYGVSLWWAGVAYFVLVMALCLRKEHGIALFMATAALLADAVLLAVMLITAPCAACLGAGAIIGLFFLVLRRHATYRLMPAPGPSFVFLAWAGLFVAAALSAGSELVAPLSFAENGNREKRVYFSPSCPACRDAVTVFAGNAVFFPVAERSSDYAAIRIMQEELEKGKTIVEALRASAGATEEPFSLNAVFFRLQLLRNKAEVAKLGFGQLPLIMINGMPENLRPHNAARAARVPEPAALPPELSPLDSCGNTPEPCAPAPVPGR